MNSKSNYVYYFLIIISYIHIQVIKKIIKMIKYQRY